MNEKTKFFKTDNLSVGYDGKVLIKNINFEIEKGKILTLIGPNGSGKSTILKSIVGRIPKIDGSVIIENCDVSAWRLKKTAQSIAAMLTERVDIEFVSCAEIVAMGRSPYTDFFGKLTEYDKRLVLDALERVNASELAERDFSTLSDGQKQRVLLAQAISREPKVLILDEPTAYLDIRHKIEFLDILRELTAQKGITIIMSLHEIDLAMKISDYIMCVKGEEISAFGTPSEILKNDAVEKLYDMKNGSYDLNFGSVELKKPNGEPKIFVIGGGGFAALYYRELQKKQIPFATGILFENDVDFKIAKALSDNVISVPSFKPMTKAHFDAAAELVRKCGGVLDVSAPIGELNRQNGRLIEFAKVENIPVYTCKN